MRFYGLVGVSITGVVQDIAFACAAERAPHITADAEAGFDHLILRRQDGLLGAEQKETDRWRYTIL